MHIGKIESLTSTRFLAALAVVLFHYTAFLPYDEGFRHFISHGNAGVCFFFILSGFILTYNYYDKFSACLHRAELIAFWRARFARVYPMHVVALVIMTPVSLYFAEQLAISHHSPLRLIISWLVNLCCIQVYLPFSLFEAIWNAPAWSIACEFFFYATFPFVTIVLIRRITSIRALLGVALLIFGAELGIFSLLITILHHRSVEPVLIDYLVYRLPFLRMFEFYIGVSTGAMFILLSRQDQQRTAPSDFWASIQQGLLHERTRNLVLLCTLVCLMAITLIPTPAGYPGRLFDDYRLYVLYTLPFALLIICLALGRNLFSPLLDHPVLVLLGEASYSLYIIHWIPLTIIRGLHDAGRPLPVALVVLIMVATIGLSIACYFFIEIPARRKLRGKRQTPVTCVDSVKAPSAV